MTEFQSSPKLVYLQIQTIVNNLLEKVKPSEDLDIDEESTSLTYDILSTLHQQITEKLSELECNAEWDNYTIAFYGETNSGKSTIIEVLRILLEEEKKLENQEKYNAWAEASGCTQTAFEQLRNDILSDEQELNENNAAWKKNKEKLEEKRKFLLTEYNKLKFQIQKRKNRANFIQRLKWVFKPLPYFPDFKNIEKDLNAHQNIISNEEKAHEARNASVQQRLDHRNGQFHQICEKVKDVERFADGAIIGNGRMDATYETLEYKFNMQGYSITLLDLPGIEGNEEKVIDDIHRSLQKAHAVVYITSKASAPESGEDENIGTFEKISKHLSGQTQVWSVYNKRITNPMALEKSTLISDDENKSLIDMDDKLRFQLGSAYQTCMHLSAYPAFLGAANCLLPGSTHLRSQEKFFDKFNARQLIKKSNIEPLLDLIRQENPAYFESKIQYSNQRKAKQIALDAINEVSNLQNDTFSPLIQQLKQNVQDADTELHTLFSTLKSRISLKVQEKVDEFEQGIRLSVYGKIDTGMENDAFSSLLEHEVSLGQTELQTEILLIVQSHVTEFQNTTKGVLERYQAQMSDLIGLYNSADIMDFSLDAECQFVDQLNWFGENADVSVSFGLYDSALSFFSGKVKKTNQKKSTDDNLRQIVKVLNENLDVSLKEIIEKYGKNLEDIREMMDKSTASVQDVQDNLLIAKNELHQLVEQLEANK